MPPKPWLTSSTMTATTDATGSMGSSETTEASPPPPPPPEPATATPVVPSHDALTSPYTSSYSRFNSPYSRPYASSYGSSYGSYGSPYGSSYGSSYGSYGSPYGGSYGSYGSSYGSPYGGSYGTPYGAPRGASSMAQSTQAAFQLLDQIVQAVGGFAHMLESTFMATHSSFHAVVALADHFGSLRQHIVNAFSVAALWSWIKRSRLPFSSSATTTDNADHLVNAFLSTKPRTRRINSKPLLYFFFLVFGVPYLMRRLIRTLPSSSSSPTTTTADTPDSHLNPSPTDDKKPIDITSIRFARALYDYKARSDSELTFKKNDIIAILSPIDLSSQSAGWWKGKLRYGPVGLVPSNYVEMVKKEE